MKILFIHEVNYEKKVIFEIHEFPELLAIRGHKVDFLQFPEHLGFKNSHLKTEFKKISGRVYKNAEINLISPPSFGGNFIDRLISTVLVIPTLWKLLSKNNYDVIVLYSVPTSGWQASIIARLKGIPIVFRALDVSHELRSSLSKRLVKWAERIVYKNVTAISANNLALGNYCVSHNTGHIPIHIIAPPLDLEHFTQAGEIDLTRSQFNLSPSDFVLVFMGTLYEFSGLDIVINQIAEHSDKNFKLLIVGGGKEEVKLKKLVFELDLVNRVIFTGVIPYQNLPQVLSLANVAINSFVPSLVTNLAFPHKVLQYLASGLITVSTKLDGLYSSLGNKAGVIWANKTDQVLDRALETKSLSQNEIETKVRQGKNFVFSELNKEKVVLDFEKMLESLI